MAAHSIGGQGALAQRGICNRWTGVLDWSGELEYWTGVLEYWTRDHNYKLPVCFVGARARLGALEARLDLSTID